LDMIVVSCVVVAGVMCEESERHVNMVFCAFYCNLLGPIALPSQL
jgi:hypothetical protein